MQEIWKNNFTILKVIQLLLLQTLIHIKIVKL